MQAQQQAEQVRQAQQAQQAQQVQQQAGPASQVFEPQQAQQAQQAQQEQQAAPELAPKQETSSGFFSALVSDTLTFSAFMRLILACLLQCERECSCVALPCPALAPGFDAKSSVLL